MTPERLSELTKQVAALTYVPTRSAGLELIAEIERLRAELDVVQGKIVEKLGSLIASGGSLTLDDMFGGVYDRINVLEENMDARLSVIEAAERREKQ